jgi:hypothetical protein
VDIDLLKLLGTEKFFAGISWDPLYCMPSYKSIWPNLTDEFLNDAISKITKVQIDMVLGHLLPYEMIVTQT